MEQIMLKTGDSTAVSIIVEQGDLAAAFADFENESYPEVLSTPAMLGLMERACARLLEPLLKDGEMSVGAKVQLSHFSPSAMGSFVTAVATFERQEGSLFWFRLRAYDGAGDVGKGEHARAIVRQSDIEEKASLRRKAI
ncbi:thioesterase family protein [Noviherbaspirillum saxi]|uniref:Thioesterase n=1 Tax=Noviherbaspirillum saxi TaxID=2320863 RepID=A0A3A3G255_9BURK|nr:hotdog domain-containing protein [Noviherbaspirillum saxi]RJF95516.1 thioesterase [Noviherbaspirillum saxi]